jgi:hypothetical protein
MQCNIGPNKKISKMGMEVCSWTKKVRVSFVVVTGRTKELQVPASWNGMESNLYHIKSAQTSSKEFYPTHGLSYCHLRTRVNQHSLAHQARRMMWVKRKHFRGDTLSLYSGPVTNHGD